MVADNYKGLRATAAKVSSATHQHCRLVWMRNALARVAPKQQGEERWEFPIAMRQVLLTPTRQMVSAA